MLSLVLDYNHCLMTNEIQPVYTLLITSISNNAAMILMLLETICQ